MEWIIAFVVFVLYGTVLAVTAAMAFRVWPEPLRGAEHDDWELAVWFAAIGWPIGLWIVLAYVLRKRIVIKGYDPNYVERLEEETKQIDKAIKRLRK